MIYVKIFYTGEKVMFEVGQKYKIYRNGATEIREKNWGECSSRICARSRQICTDEIAFYWRIRRTYKLC